MPWFQSPFFAQSEPPLWSLPSIANIGQAIEGLVALVTMTVGAVWAVWWVRKRRDNRGKLEFEVAIRSIKEAVSDSGTPGLWLIEVTGRVTNRGGVREEIGKLDFTVLGQTWKAVPEGLSSGNKARLIEWLDQPLATGSWISDADEHNVPFVDAGVSVSFTKLMAIDPSIEVVQVKGWLKSENSSDLHDGSNVVARESLPLVLDEIDANDYSRVAPLNNSETGEYPSHNDATMNGARVVPGSSAKRATAPATPLEVEGPPKS